MGIWDESFMTFYRRIDDEHKVLFDCIRESAEDPSNAEKHAFCKTKLRMHFDYGGKLHLRRHYVVPEPYIWEPSFSVGDKQPYTQMDDEHVGLFDIVRDVEADRNNQ